MTPPPSPFPTEALLAQAGWLRSLALSLVGDVQRADDLAQDTWVRALEHPPRADQPLRGWLATVMRNLLRQEHRGDQRRRDREARVASARNEPGDPGADAVLARATMQRELVECVLTLEEPYRRVVLLRYFEELAPRRIAVVLGVPVSTVKTRLARGLERLRRRLDERYGRDGEGWVMALLPVLARPAGLATSGPLSLASLGAFGALAVNSKILLAAATLTAVGAGYFLTRPDTDRGQAASVSAATPVPPVAEAAPFSPPPPSAAGALPREPESSERRIVPAEAEPAPQTAAVEASAPRVVGRVVDLDGRPVAGVDIVALEHAEGTAPLGTSGPDGSFAAERPSASSLGVRSERHVTVMAGTLVEEGSGKEAVLVVADRLELAGHVVDEFAGTVAGARVRLEPPTGWRARLGWILDFSQELRFSANSDASGAFRFAAAPRFPGGSLHAQSPGYRETSAEAPTVSSSDVVLVLERPDLAGNELTGVVVDPQGFGVAGAGVSLGIDTTTTAEDGSFAFDLADPDSFNVQLGGFVENLATDGLVAIHAGYLPARLAARGTGEDGRPIWPDHVVLRLGGPPLSIHGRVVDGEDEPLAGVRVWIEDPSFFGGRAGDSRFPDLTHVETELAGLDPSWPFVETDEQGEFRLDGLTDREYTLEAMDPVTLARVRRSGVPAGAFGVELVVPLADSWETLRGQVVDGRGQPVAGASVRVNCDAFRTRIQGQVARTRHASAGGVETDARGRFELERVPKQYAYFRVDHPDTIPVEVGRSEQALRELVGDDHDDFEIVVQRRCHFQIALAEPGLADTFEMLDAEGTPLQLSEFEAGGRRDGYRFVIEGGLTSMLAVGDGARTLVLYLGDEEVQRMPVELTPGDQPTLRP